MNKLFTRDAKLLIFLGVLAFISVFSQVVYGQPVLNERSTFSLGKSKSQIEKDLKEDKSIHNLEVLHGTLDLGPSYIENIRTEFVITYFFWENPSNADSECVGITLFAIATNTRNLVFQIQKGLKEDGSVKVLSKDRYLKNGKAYKFVIDSKGYLTMNVVLYPYKPSPDWKRPTK